MKSFNLLLYAVTDRAWLGDRALAEQVEMALKGGATLLQLREKELDYNEFLSEAKEIKKICQKYDVPFIINDNIEVAIACGADGLHIGQSDMPSSEARELIGRNKILGVSVANVEQARAAYENGADYLGAGAVFATSSKDDAYTVSLETLRQICLSVPIPVVAIGGISDSNILALKDTGIAGVSVISALFAKDSIEEAARALLDLAKQVV